MNINERKRMSNLQTNTTPANSTSVHPQASESLADRMMKIYQQLQDALHAKQAEIDRLEAELAQARRIAAGKSESAGGSAAPESSPEPFDVPESVLPRRSAQVGRACASAAMNLVERRDSCPGVRRTPLDEQRFDRGRSASVARLRPRCATFGFAFRRSTYPPDPGKRPCVPDD